MPGNFDLMRSVEHFGRLVDKLTATPGLLGFDIETGYLGEPRESVSVHPFDPASMVVGFSFSADPDWARYVPLTHDNGDNLDPYLVAPLLWKLLVASQLVIHNWLFEQVFLQKFFREYLPADHPAALRDYLIQDAGPDQHDTMIEAYLLADYRLVGLKPLSKEVLGVDQAELMSLFPGLPDKDKNKLRFNTLEPGDPAVYSYACEDSARALELHQVFYERVKDHPLLQVEYLNQPIIRGMEQFGVQYDWPKMASDSVMVNAFNAKLRDEIMVELGTMVGEPVDINLGSTQQIAHVLFDQLGMEVIKRSKKTSNPSTDAEALAGLAKRHPVVKKIVTWKELKKLTGTYLDKYERTFQYAPDGRTHPSHLQARVPSGRYAVQDPPYQQTPKTYHEELTDGTTMDVNFRGYIVAPPVHYQLGFDFSQVEVRVIAGVSAEPSLMRAFDEGRDIHTATASMMFGVSPEQVTKELRSQGKTLNLALLYQMSSYSLATRLQVSKEEGQRLYDLYFSAFTSIRKWMDGVIAAGKRNGHVFTPFGRKVTIWELRDTNRNIVEKGERLCVNAPIQGGAADYMKIAMIRQDRALRRAGLADRVHLVMNIHDALEYYVHESVDPIEVIRLLNPEVTFATPFLPKIVADWHYGQSWGTLTELEIRDDVVYLKGTDTVWTRELLPTPAEPELEDLPVWAGDSDTEDENEDADALPVVKRWLVAMAEMPTAEQFSQALELLAAGTEVVVLQLPEGELELPARYVVTKAVRHQLTLLLGASVTVDPASVSGAELFAGIDVSRLRM